MAAARATRAASAAPPHQAREGVLTTGVFTGIHRPFASPALATWPIQEKSYDPSVAIISRGFKGRRQSEAPANRVPPGQYVTNDFPVLSAGPTPRVSLEDWRLTLVTEAGDVRSWTWAEFRALPSEEFTVDIHCVTKWSKLDTRWEGVAIDSVLGGAGRGAGFLLAESYGGYTTNLPLADVVDGKAWVAFGYDGAPLAPEHGGPARLLVPHLYFWKSAKWIRRLELSPEDRIGFWEGYGYHNYGDPWREQRYAGD